MKSQIQHFCHSSCPTVIFPNYTILLSQVEKKLLSTQTWNQSNKQLSVAGRYLFSPSVTPSINNLSLIKTNIFCPLISTYHHCSGVSAPWHESQFIRWNLMCHACFKAALTPTWNQFIVSVWVSTYTIDRSVDSRYVDMFEWPSISRPLGSAAALHVSG